MGAFHKAESGIHRGSKNFFNSQILQSQNIPDYINNGINGADFMEMNLFYRTAVYLCFCFGNCQKNFFGFGNDFFSESGMLQNLFNIMKIPMFVMMRVVVVNVFVLMLMMMFVSVFMMIMNAILFVHMFMVMAVGNAVSMHPGVIMLMIVLMLVFMVMEVSVSTFVLLFFRQQHIKVPCLDSAFIHALKN